MAPDCEACWRDLQAGKYDWTHLAMAIWPERVKEKAQHDRSFAIHTGSQRSGAGRSAGAPGLANIGAARSPKPRAAAAGRGRGRGGPRQPRRAFVKVLKVAEVPLGRALLLGLSKVDETLWRPVIMLLVEQGLVEQGGARLARCTACRGRKWTSAATSVRWSSIS